MAIMGFGGGAMICSPLGTKLMAFYKASEHPIAATWVTMGILYFSFMLFGAITIRLPRERMDAGGVNATGEAVGHDQPYSHGPEGYGDAAVLAVVADAGA